MTRAAGTSVEQNFAKGLITEATGMNFPENACSETYDCVFRAIGAVVRRPGFEPEEFGEYQSVTSDKTSVAEFVWRNVANLGELTFVVQQIGMTLYFFEVSGSALSLGIKAQTISLSTYRTSGSPTTGDGWTCQFSSGDGKLFVTHPYCTPFYVTYDSSGDSLAATAISVEIRDFKRQADGYEYDERPATLTDLHKYNLYNQGWYWSGASSSGGTGSGAAQNLSITLPSGSTASSIGGNNMLNYWDAHRSDFPSNADIWWLFKNSDEVIDYQNFNKIYRGNSPAPNGHFIVNPFLTNRQVLSGISGIAEDTAGAARPSVNAFHAGRLFMGGTAAAGYGDKIYFSQIIEDVTQIGRCYQLNDPTSEENADLLPSDGGVIVIQGMGTLIALRVVGTALIVLASNGVWSISGGSALGFLASDYSVQKISSTNASGSMSVVEVDGGLLWWNYNGIYVLSADQGGVATVQSATDATIKSFYDDIPQNNIPYVKGAFNPNDMLVQWVYRSTTAANTTESFQYDRVLNLRTNTKSFYPWTIGTSADVSGAPSISGILCITGSGVSRVEEVVTVGGVTVTVPA